VTASRAVAFFVALVVLLVSLSAEAKKKKKASKKHKTPAAKHTSKSTKKSTKSKESDRGLPPVESAPETDEASKEKEAPSKKPAGEPEEPAGGEKAPGEGEKKPSPPPEEETAVKPPPPKTPKAPAETAEGREGAPVALQLGLGGRALFRDLSWTQANGALAPYSLKPGPELALWLETYPAAFMTDGFAGNIGIYGHFNYGLGASSKTPPPENQTLTTKYYDFLAGVKIRIPLGTFLPYVAGAYGMQKFALTPTDVSRPNFNYTFVSGGAGTRIQLTPALDIDLGAAFLYVLNPGSAAGEVASNSFYPDATANGIDAALSIGFRILSSVGLRAGGDFRQLGLSTHYKTTNMGPRAGGATDRNIGVWGGIEIAFDGMGGGGGEEPAPAKKAPAKAKKPAPGEGEPEEEPSVGTGAGKDDEGGAAGAGKKGEGAGAGPDGDL
jgi:hypothetical protein